MKISRKDMKPDTEVPQTFSEVRKTKSLNLNLNDHDRVQ